MISRKWALSSSGGRSRISCIQKEGSLVKFQDGPLFKNLLTLEYIKLNGFAKTSKERAAIAKANAGNGLLDILPSATSITSPKST